MGMSNDSELMYSEKELETILELHKLKSGTPTDDLPVGSRQILIVKAHIITSSNYLESASSNKTDSSSVIMLTGKASPSSDQTLDHAYIHFFNDTSTLARPYYNKARGEIKLSMHYRNLPTVLAQLHEPQVYCWIGHFASGHIYGDIHTGH
jgi:hypothetical protein